METTMTTIKTIEGLVEALQNKPNDVTYLHILKSVDIPLQEFERFYTWNNEHYTRNCLIKTDDFELLLICWEKGQQSPIHDFHTQAAWIHPIQGRLKEEQFQLINDQLEQVSSVLLGTTEFSYMTEPITIHRYTNNYEARSVSLNLYAKPLEKWSEYDPVTSESIDKEIIHHASFKF